MVILLIGKDKELENFIEEENFSKMGVWERNHMEEWISKCPKILGEKLLIITTEYDKFDKTSNRLDILAVDTDGKIVVIELKRDVADKFTDLQSIHYAAYISTHTFKDIVEIRAKYCGKSEEEVDGEIRDFIVNDEFSDFDNQPRIIIVANQFKEETLASVLWLRDVGADITCVKLEAYKVGEKIVITPNIIIPLPEAKNFMMHREQKIKSISIPGNYTEDFHLKNRPEDVKILYNQIKEKILNLGSNVEVKPKKLYIAFVDNSNFIYSKVHQKNIKMILNLKKGELFDPENLTEDVSEIGRHGNGDYRITIEPGQDLEYLMQLIEQAHIKHS